MAAFVLTSATVGVSLTWTGTAPGLPGTQTISGTLASSSDLTTFVTDVAFELGADTKPTTNFGSGGFVSVLASLKSTAVTLGLNQDFAASQLHSIVNTTLGGLGATVFMDIRATSAARGPTNPSYVFAVILTSYSPIMGAVGDKAGLSVTWPSTGAFTALVA